MRTTKTATVVGFGLLVLLLTSGCGGSNTGETRPVDASTGSTSNSPTSKASSQPDIVASVAGTYSAPHRPRGADEVFQDDAAKAIVRGTVTDVSYKYFNNVVAMTAMTVAVEKGQGVTDSTITVWENGGLIPVASLDDRDRKQLIGDKDVSRDAVVSFEPPFAGDRAEVGDYVLLFLEPVSGGVTAGGYNVLDDNLGRFERAPDGTYVRAAVMENAPSKEREVLTAQTVQTELG